MTKVEREAYEEDLDTVMSSASMAREYLPVGDCPICGARLFEQEDGRIDCEMCNYTT